MIAIGDHRPPGVRNRQYTGQGCSCDDRLPGARNRHPPSYENKLQNKIWRADELTVVQIELGTACGKLFRCGTMVVLDAGDSDILSQET